MSINLANAPCSWGVDYADDINNPNWKDVFREISESGYHYCEIGPYGFLPQDLDKSQDYLNELNLEVVGGFIFDHLIIKISYIFYIYQRFISLKIHN